MKWHESAAHDGKQSRSSTERGLSTSGTQQQTQTGSSNVIPVTESTILGISTAVISHLGGTWPPDGTRTIAARSVLPATSTIKDVNSFLASGLMKKNRAKQPESTSAALIPQSWVPPTSSGWPFSSKKRIAIWSNAPTPPMTEEDITRLHNLRAERIAALLERRKKAFRTTSNELYMLTGNYGYKA